MYVIKPQKIDRIKGIFISNMSIHKAIGSLFQHSPLPLDSPSKSSKKVRKHISIQADPGINFVAHPNDGANFETLENMPQYLRHGQLETIQDDDDDEHNGFAYDMDDYRQDTHGTTVPFG